MSSADKLERGKLEEEFQNRMHDAEVAPAPDLWNRIDHDLTVKENQEYKDRIFMYKRLAAACFVLFMLAGALLLFEYKTKVAVPGTTITAPAKEAAGSIAAADKGADNPAKATDPAPGAVLPEGKSSASSAPAGAVRSWQYAADGMVAGTEPLGSSGKAPASPSMPLEADELPQLHTDGKEAAIAAKPTETEPGNSNSGFLSGVPEVAGSEKPDADKLAVQQMLRQAGSIMAMTKEPKSRQEQLASAASSSRKDESQADALKKSLDNLTASDKKAAVTTGGNSRMSLGMAYGPAYFNQNIGLPNQMMGAVSQNSLASSGPSTTRMAADNMEAARDEFEENTDAAFSYNVEARTGIRLGKKWKLLTGIGYSRNSARTKTSYIIRQYWFRPNTREPYELASTIFLPSLNNGFTTDSISVEQTDPFYVNYDYRLLSVPLGLQYESKIGKDWYWYVAGGMAANFNLGSEIKAASAEIGSVKYSSRDEDSPFRKVQFSGNVGAGIGKRVSESVMVVIGPEFRSFFSTMLARPDDALAPQGKPYTIGVNMGIQYTLGKK